ncbi:hypothetical protein OSB04_009321, partial [Centaurea solstitialis]
MKGILLRGHKRPLTLIKYNDEGDLLVSCAKDHRPTVWFADNGKRLGTYAGHNGAVWCCDISRDSTQLITGSVDQSAKLWDVESGRQLFSFGFDSPARAVEFGVGDKIVVITTDPFMGLASAIRVKRIAADPDDRDCGDIRSLTLIKTYFTQTPVNAVAMSPLLNHVSFDSCHVVLGGGQEASAVTTTDHRAGKFEAKFYDKILQEEIGGVKGHFGPINALAFNPDGK